MQGVELALGTKNLWAKEGDKEEDKEQGQKRKKKTGKQIKAQK